MIDIRLVREFPDIVKSNIKKKFQDHKLKLVDEAKKKDEEWRKLKTKADGLRADRNRVSLDIALAKKAGKSAASLMKKAKGIPDEIAKVEVKTGKLENEIKEILMQIPNILHSSVPVGKDASANVERQKIGVPKKFDFPLKSHIEIAESLGIADFETSAKTSGNGFYYLIGDLALLNQALIRYGIDMMHKKGFTYVEPPLMIRKKVLDGVYSAADISQMSYKIDGEDLYLIATSEHSLIGMFIEKTLNHKELPVRYAGYSMCFRKEVGSHGINEKGLFRTHQFNKVEMVVVCKPEDSYKFYDEILNTSIEVYKNLGIPTRVLESCSGDLSDLKAKGADLEFWSPIEKEYKEIGSITNMEEAQARRLNIKYSDKDGKNKFAHTLNNTVIATSRAMRAILENCQQKDGTVKVPDVLLPYMHGIKFLGKK